jgi:hypothetical protein
MLDKSKRTPLFTPLKMLLQSRRVLIAIAALLVGLLVMAFPELQAVRGELLTLVITLSLALIGGYSVEDAATAARQIQLQDEVREQLKTVLTTVVDELLAEREE